MSLDIDFAAFLTCGGENGTNGWHLAVFSEDIAFACHFMAFHSPPTLPPYRSASGIGYTYKKLSIQLAIQYTVDTGNYLE